MVCQERALAQKFSLFLLCYVPTKYENSTVARVSDSGTLKAFATSGKIFVSRPPSGVISARHTPQEAIHPVSYFFFFFPYRIAGVQKILSPKSHVNLSIDGCARKITKTDPRARDTAPYNDPRGRFLHRKQIPTPRMSRFSSVCPSVVAFLACLVLT